MVVFADAEQQKRVDFLKRREEEELAQMLSHKYGVEYIDLSLVAVNSDALRLIPEATAREAEMAAFGAVGKRVSVAVRAPENPKVKQEVERLTEAGYSVVQFMASQESLKRAFERYEDLSYATESKAGVFTLSNTELEEILERVKGLTDIGALIDEAVKSMKHTYRITRILEIILAGAMSTGASDIHFEPEESVVRLRYRLDGVLVDVLTFDFDTYRLALSRLKLLSGLKLNITADAQDGRFSIKIKGDEIEIRSSILPGNYAETIVLRILNPKSIAVPLEELGIEPKLLARIEREVVKPNGMILTTGPTGSGKTTTLYAFMRRVNSPGTKIITIEDPVEYHLNGIVQTQVDKKNYSFAAGLRSALRQDPDIIMVGEIRDDEVAEVAINAALTGHLVFSTLHTNNAAGSFPRLIDLGVSEKVISSAVSVAMAQRLVRKLCTACKQVRTASAEEQKTLDYYVNNLVDKSLVPQNRSTISVANEQGCPECRGRGYKGRIGIHEAIFMDSAIEEILRSKPSEREVAQAARPQGVPTMQEAGILKVLRGITSLEELRRVVDLHQESSAQAF
jgi:type II secretory ATPase GspE/PulE/Tfp pilus assembly ATPase PilB-like protein